ncbi:MAG: hypothetical protein QXI33_03680 [Candidatus Pacearchaeota archaeon]
MKLKIISGLSALIFSTGCGTLEKLEKALKINPWESPILTDKREISEIKNYEYDTLLSTNPPDIYGLNVEYQDSNKTAIKPFACEDISGIEEHKKAIFPEDFTGVRDNYFIGENFFVVMPIPKNHEDEFIVELFYLENNKRIAWNTYKINENENTIVVNYKILIISDYKAAISVYKNGKIEQEIGSAFFSVSKKPE